MGSGGAITENGSGLVTLSGLLANTYSGLTTVNAGELDLNKTGAVAVPGNLSVSGGTVKLLQSNQIANGSMVAVSSGTLAVQSFSDTVDGLELAGGSISGTGQLTSLTAVDAEGGSASASLGGSAGLTKTTAGIVTLLGTNSYSGSTLVKRGTLIVRGSLAGTSAVTIGDSTNLAGTAVLGGGGSVGNVTLGAAAGDTGAWLQPSDGTAESTSTGGTTLGTGSLTVFAGSQATISLQIGRTAATSGKATNTGDTSDHIKTTGNVTLDGNLQLTLEAGYTPVLHDVLYLIINGSGNSVSGQFATVNGSALAGNGQFVFDGVTWLLTKTANYNGSSFTNGNDVAIEVVAVPEPADVAIFLSGAGMLLLLRRSRRFGR